MYSKSLFLFSQDLRTYDNTALNQCMNESTSVIPCYVFDEPPSVKLKKNPYLFRYLIESLMDLKKDLSKVHGRLSIFSGKITDVLRSIGNEISFDAIYLNRRYIPQWELLKKELDTMGIPVHVTEDYVLNKPESILTKTKKPYQVFTAYFNTARKIPVHDSVEIDKKKYHDSTLPGNISLSQEISGNHDHGIPHFQGGRDQALHILHNLRKFVNYAIERDIPSISGTTSLSAHLHLGTCSVREVYHGMVHQLGIEHPLVRQLYWREFYIYVGVHFPYVFTENFQKKYNKLEWSYDSTLFQKWKEGMTGFPIVDAGMRKLNQTGYMHNRIRMIVGSFLTKDLHIDWKWGERYFQEKLADFDPMLNNGNWQWVAGTGCDAAPYFRVFNPWSQQQKFDSSCGYIKTWIPELRKVDSSKIHNIPKKSLPDSISYPKPIIDHSMERINSLAMYKAV